MWFLIIFSIIFWKLLKLFWKFARYSSLIQTILSKRSQIKLAGEWAIVTGATDGIGRAFCEELARDGLNIFLISRSTEKLNLVASELQLSYKVKTKIFTADFCKVDFYEDLATEINSLSSVACLINNVGISQVCSGPVACCDFISIESIQNIINCNTISTACMSRITLAKMLKQTRTAKPCIINMGSVSGLFPRPYKSLYAGAKAFVHNFAASIGTELVDEHIRVLTLCPGFISTANRGSPSTNFLQPSARVFAGSALNMIGVDSMCCGYLGHEFMVAGMAVLPNLLRDFLVAKFELRKRRLYLTKNKAD